MKKILLALLIAIMLSSCTSERDADLSQEDIRRADMVLENGTFVLYQERELPITFQAGLVSFYDPDSSAELENMSFFQLDDSGSVIIEGRAEYAELNTETRFLTLEGNAMLNSIRDGMLIETNGTLYFNTNTQEVESEGEVHVVSSDGEFSSSSFYGNLLLNEYSFSDLKEGRIAN